MSFLCYKLIYLLKFITGIEMDTALLEILACPVCKGDLDYDKNNQELICHKDNLAYPIRDDIPVMLETEARVIELK